MGQADSKPNSPLPDSIPKVNLQFTFSMKLNAQFSPDLKLCSWFKSPDTLALTNLEENKELESVKLTGLITEVNEHHVITVSNIYNRMNLELTSFQIPWLNYTENVCYNKDQKTLFFESNSALVLWDIQSNSKKSGVRLGKKCLSKVWNLNHYFLLYARSLFVITIADEKIRELISPTRG
jgi:hypothetical protein